VRWEKWTDYSIKSQCGKYAISRAVVNGQDKFTAWKLPSEVLGFFGEAHSAKQHVEDVENDQSKKASP